MRLETIRGEIDSPGWLNRLTARNRKEAQEAELRKAENKQKEAEALAETVAKRLKLGKQEPKVTTTEVEKPVPTENKVDAKAILDVLKEIAETLENHARAIEDLADKVDQISSVQATRPTGRAPVTQNEPSERDLEIINSRFEQIGLNGEIRKIIRDPYIEGRFSG